MLLTINFYLRHGHAVRQITRPGRRFGFRRLRTTLSLGGQGSLVGPDSYDIAGLGLVIEMQFDTTNVQLPQNALDAPLNGRMVCTVASDELLNNGSERRWGQFRVWDTHGLSLPVRLYYFRVLDRPALFVHADPPGNSPLWCVNCT